MTCCGCCEDVPWFGVLGGVIIFVGIVMVVVMGLMVDFLSESDRGPRACPGLVCLPICLGHTLCHNLVKIIVIPLLWSFLSIVARSTSTFLCWSHKFGQQENKTGFKILSPNFNQEKKWLNATQFRVLVFRLWLAFQSIFSSTQSQLIQTLIFRL